MSPERERPVIRILFDGGSRGNPGPGYGSYQIRFPDGRQETVHRDFGQQMTGNEAEYQALLAALEDLLGRLQRDHLDPRAFAVDIQGDSALVIYQVRGDWKARHPRLQALRERVRELLETFGDHRLERVPRGTALQHLGH
ncbi:MAG: reverse transcriptase-like protein [Anaerolineae bacterium]